MELIVYVVNGKEIYVGTTENVCLCCGCPVPEGKEICPICENATVV